jgi:Ca2+-binding EF-hand superfamily protein
MKTIPVSLVLASAFVTAFAFAAPETPPGPSAPDGGGEPRGGPRERKSPEDFWKRADANADGAISREEFFALERIAKLPEEKRAKIFARLDTDQSGSLSKEELQEMRRGPGRHGFPKLQELDADRSGGVNFDEFKTSPFVQKLPPEEQEGLFKRLDTDGDGQITPKDRPPHPRGGKGLWKRLDSDGDGAVSFEEFQKAPFIARLSEDEREKRFQELDRNGDKKLGEDEMPQPPPRPKPPEGPPAPADKP